MFVLLQLIDLKPEGTPLKLRNRVPDLRLNIDMQLRAVVDATTSTSWHTVNSCKEVLYVSESSQVSIFATKGKFISTSKKKEL